MSLQAIDLPEFLRWDMVSHAFLYSLSVSAKHFMPLSLDNYPAVKAQFSLATPGESHPNAPG